jgi:hypothetical protein
MSRPRFALSAYAGQRSKTARLSASLVTIDASPVQHWILERQIGCENLQLPTRSAQSAFADSEALYCRYPLF